MHARVLKGREIECDVALPYGSLHYDLPESFTKKCKTRWQNVEKDKVSYQGERNGQITDYIHYQPPIELHGIENNNQFIYRITKTKREKTQMVVSNSQKP